MIQDERCPHLCESCFGFSQQFIIILRCRIKWAAHSASLTAWRGLSSCHHCVSRQFTVAHSLYIEAFAESGHFRGVKQYRDLIVAHSQRENIIGGPVTSTRACSDMSFSSQRHV